MLMMSDLSLLWNNSIQSLIRPRMETFEQQAKKVNTQAAIIWVAAAGAITGFTQAAVLMYDYTNLFSGPVPTHITAYLSIGLVVQSFIMAIAAAGLLLILSGTYYTISSAIGGRGSFAAQTYLMASYTAPLFFLAGILYRILQLSPVSLLLYGHVSFQVFLYLLISGLVFLGYHTFLSSLTIRVVYKFNKQKAFRVIRVFVGVVGLLIIGYGILTVGLPFLFFQLVE